MNALTAKQENTQLIAEFMGQTVIQYKGKPTFDGNKYAKTIGEKKKLWGGLEMEFTGRFVRDVNYPFDTDFNLLIPIIARIEKQGYVVAIAGISYKIYRVMDEQNPIKALVCGDLSQKTSMTYLLVTSFLKWLSETK